jgi:hypothetical protein
MRRFGTARPVVTALAVFALGSMAWGLAGDDEAVVIRLVAYLGATDYELDLDPSADPAVEILPCYPTNQPFLGAADDPVLVARSGDAIAFERQWIDPSRFLVEPPDDGGDGSFTPPTQVTFQLTLPWTGQFTTLDYYANPADREAGAPRQQVDLSNAISSYLERGGREQTDVLCQDPEALDALRQTVDTEARIDEALKEIGEEDPR